MPSLVSYRVLRFALLLLIPVHFVAGAEPPPKRNVLFVIVDDLNNRLGCYGDPIVKTPNIDRLAQHAVRFDRAYCQSPLCNPSRTSLLSGRYPATTRVLENDTPSRVAMPDVQFLPEYFKANGYFTGKIGKVPHEEFDAQVSWDLNEKVGEEGEDSRPSKSEKGKDAKKARERERQLPEEVAWRALDMPDGETLDGRTARTAVKVLEEHASQPFFIAAGFHKPHRPYEAPKKYYADYPPDKMPLPKEPADIREHVPPIAFDTYGGYDDTKLPDYYKGYAVAAYSACVTFIDAQIGLLVDTMDRLKLWDNTVVVLTSDHGYLLGEHGGMWRKMSLFEEAARVPLLIAAPGMQRDAACARTVESIDLYPTLVDLCGLPQPAGLEGHSLMPLLKDPKAPWDIPAHTFTQHRKYIGQSVRTERWRLTLWGADGQEGMELYDHDSDPKEWVNLAADPKFASVIESLKKDFLPIDQPEKKKKKQ